MERSVQLTVHRKHAACKRSQQLPLCRCAPGRAPRPRLAPQAVAHVKQVARHGAAKAAAHADPHAQLHHTKHLGLLQVLQTPAGGVRCRRGERCAVAARNIWPSAPLPAFPTRLYAPGPAQAVASARLHRVRQQAGGVAQQPRAAAVHIGALSRLCCLGIRRAPRICQLALTRRGAPCGPCKHLLHMACCTALHAGQLRHRALPRRQLAPPLGDLALRGGGRRLGRCQLLLQLLGLCLRLVCSRSGQRRAQLTCC